MRKARGGIRRRWRLRDIWFAIGAILLVLWIMFITVSTVTMFALAGSAGFWFLQVGEQA